jgi:adhesin HecA-like repeat protein
LLLSGSSFGADASNAGRIEGGTVGAELGTTLVNTGTITGGTAGVLLTGYGTLDNRAGGVVSSAGDAVSAAFGTFGLFSFNCQSASKKDPLSACKRDPFVEQRDEYDGRTVRAGCGVGRA